MHKHVRSGQSWGVTHPPDVLQSLLPCNPRRRQHWFNLLRPSGGHHGREDVPNEVVLHQVEPLGWRSCAAERLGCAHHAPVHSPSPGCRWYALSENMGAHRRVLAFGSLATPNGHRPFGPRTSSMSSVAPPFRPSRA
jgi:hypothetical protein